MKKIGKAVIIGTALLMCSQTAFGAGLNAGAVLDTSTGKLQIDGTGENNKTVTVIVIPYDMDETKLGKIETENGDVLFNMTHTDDIGRFNLEMGLKDEWDAGMYKALISDGCENTQIWFTYVDSSMMEEGLKKINKASAEQIKDILITDGSCLGSDEEVIQKYGENIGKYLFANRPEKGYDAESFVKAYTAGVAVSMVKSGSSLESIVLKFSKYMGIDIEEYEKNTQAVKKELERLVKNAEISDGTIKEIYDYMLLLAKINEAESDTMLQEIVLDNKEELKLNLSAYNKLSSEYKKLQIFAKMRESKYDTYEAVKNAFEEACTQIGEEENSGSVSGGRGSGSGGGIYSNVTNESLSNTNTEPEKDNLWDVKGHWAEKTVLSLAEKNIISGYPDGKFVPDGNITRAEFSKLMSVALGFKTAEYKDEYIDVGRDDWFSGYVLGLSDEGIITGYNRQFYPNENISRQDAATIAWRALENRGVIAKSTVDFGDAEEISDYAKSAVAKLAGLGVINGFDGCFSPLNNTTRAEAATILSNMMNVLDLD